MNAIEAIDSEIQQLQDQLARLRQARALLKGDAPAVQVPQMATFRPEPVKAREPDADLGPIAAAVRVWVHQVRGQFFTSDIVRKLHQQGFPKNGKTAGACTQAIAAMVQRGEVHIAFRRKGIPGNTYIKTSELEAATAPSTDGEKLKGGLE